MWSARKLLRWAFGARWIDVAQSDEYQLVLHYGVECTRLEKNSGLVLKNGKVLARLTRIQAVNLQWLHDGDETPSGWLISLEMHEQNPVVLGQISDELDASMLAARVATFCGKPVVVRAV